MVHLVRLTTIISIQTTVGTDNPTVEILKLEEISKVTAEVTLDLIREIIEEEVITIISILDQVGVVEMFIT